MYLLNEYNSILIKNKYYACKSLFYDNEDIEHDGDFTK